MSETSTPQATTPPPHHSSSIIYIIALLFLITGIVAGYILSIISPTKQSGSINTNTAVDTKELSLPPDAVRIQACSDHRGALYVRPQDVPAGPIYMVHNGKIMGLEFMLDQGELSSGKAFKYLSALGMKVDHVNTGLLPHGHAGYAESHYHIDLYTVQKSVEDTITCPGGSSDTMENMPGMDTSPSATIKQTDSMKPMQSSGSAMPAMR